MNEYEWSQVCHLTMPDEDNKILKYVSGEKSLKVPFIIYADFVMTYLWCLLRKINTCMNNPEKSYAENCHYTGK